MELVCSFWGYAGDRPDEARERMRRSVLAYAMVPTHQHCFAGCFPRLAEAAEAWGAGDRRRALGCVDDAVVDAVCAVGEDAVRRRIAEYRQVGIDTPILLPTGVTPGDCRWLDADSASLRSVMHPSYYPVARRSSLTLDPVL